MRVILAFIALMGVCSDAFMTCPSKPLVLTQLSLMTGKELEVLKQKVTECAEEECPVDAVDDLIIELKSQQEELTSRVEHVRNMINSLEVLNDTNKEPEKRSEVAETVRAIMRIFAMSPETSGNDFPDSGIALGFSGDIRKPTTAYKALKPKPWKAPKP
eukprot:CAMPEP_0194243802 /NCGR_PEP_ID=MMETSP0158-20130606/9704_1 /TAXON_ID=33649 /ORGANISM="Thalassionema nitzschioides, Strain L26-B" /LENGTH=158 /DNA_ID=CAMNT_0038979119 /DNA_START=62 /DNA_END=538 /DNA_ORIENTATION=-